MKRYLFSALPILTLLCFWEGIVRSGIVNEALFPSPIKVIYALVAMIGDGTLLLDLRDSLWRLFAGLILGSCVGIFAGLLTGRSNLVRRIFYPVIQLLRCLPPVAIIPLIIVWLGIGNDAKIFSIAFAVFFPVWINSYIGALNVPRAYLWSGKLFLKSSFQRLRKIVLPAALPFVLAGIRIGIAVAFVMVFVSELAGASSGLGYRISVTQLSYRIDQMIAALIVLGLLGAITDELFQAISKKVFPWLPLSYESTY